MPLAHTAIPPQHNTPLTTNDIPEALIIGAIAFLAEYTDEIAKAEDAAYTTLRTVRLKLIGTFLRGERSTVSASALLDAVSEHEERMIANIGVAQNVGWILETEDTLVLAHDLETICNRIAQGSIVFPA